MILNPVVAGKSGGGAQVYTGSYIGNGAVGSGGKTVLSFPFEPKFVIIFAETGNAMAYFQNDGTTILGRTMGADDKMYLLPTTLDSDNNLSFYIATSFSDAPAYQMNVSGRLYLYTGIG